MGVVIDRSSPSSRLFKQSLQGITGMGEPFPELPVERYQLHAYAIEENVP